MPRKSYQPYLKEGNGSLNYSCLQLVARKEEITTMFGQQYGRR
jgi:hypothetical protein